MLAEQFDLWHRVDHFGFNPHDLKLVGGNPRPALQFDSMNLISHGPIPFQKRNTSLWLPKSAEIYFDFRKHRYYRRHSFDHYMLYSVDSDEKRKEPVSKPLAKDSSPEQSPINP
jgi:hypothetical protein